MNQPIQNTQEIREMPVDAAQITRKSVMQGAWEGMKKGMFWSGLGACGLSAVGGVLAIGMAKSAATAGIGGFLAAGPLGKVIGGALAWMGIKAVGSLGGPAEIAFELMSTVLSTAVTVGLPIMAVGALIGGVVGAVKGYTQADDKIILAQQQARREARQMELERQQTQLALQQQQEVGQKFSSQTHDLYASNEASLGQFRPAALPPAPMNRELEDERGRPNGFTVS